MADDDINDYSKNLAMNIHSNIADLLSKLHSEKRGKITEAVLSGAINAYVEVNRSSNSLAGSADKQRAHLKEEHPELAPGTPPAPRLDLHLTGGKRNLSLESELDGPKSVAADFKKLGGRPTDEDKVIVTETKSDPYLGSFTPQVRKASVSDGGTYTHVEIHRPKNRLASTSTVRTTTFTNGKIIYDSHQEDSNGETQDKMLIGGEMELSTKPSGSI